MISSLVGPIQLNTQPLISTTTKLEEDFKKINKI